MFKLLRTLPKLLFLFCPRNTQSLRKKHQQKNGQFGYPFNIYGLRKKSKDNSIQPDHRATPNAGEESRGGKRYRLMLRGDI